MYSCTMHIYRLFVLHSVHLSYRLSPHVCLALGALTAALLSEGP